MVQLPRLRPEIAALLLIGIMPGAALAQQPNTLDPYDRALALAQSGAAKGTRIIGGIPASLVDNPWQVALVIKEVPANWAAQFCGGAYLGNGWVLTAAHCAQKSENQIEVFYGSAKLDSTGQRAVVTRKVIAPNYDATTRPPRCGSACKRDPVSGVIGIQKGTTIPIV